MVVKAELVVWPALANQELVPTSLPLDAPPIRCSAANTRRALVAGQLLTQHQERNVESRRRQFIILDPISDHLDGQSLRVADGRLARLPVAHNSRQFQSLGNPSAVVFPVEFNGKAHCFVLRQTASQFMRLGE